MLGLQKKQTKCERELAAVKKAVVEGDPPGLEASNLCIITLTFLSGCQKVGWCGHEGGTVE